MAVLSVDQYIVSEADGFVDIVVRLDVAPSAGQTFTVNYATSASYGTATSGADYTHDSNTLTFTEGVSEQTVRVFITQNTTIESFESFFFVLSNPTGGATIARTSTLIGIVDNDNSAPTPSLSVRDVVIDEKDGTATFTVLLGGHNGQSSNSDVTVNYATASGSATAGSDFVGQSGSLTFLAGETVKNVVVQINDDLVAEGAERFFLNLSSPTGATILNGQGVATIGASDRTAVSQPRITVQDAVVGEGDGYVDVVVSLSAPGQNVVSVNYSANLSYDTAAYSSDYTYVNGTLTFAQGETTQVVRIQLIDDGSTEALEHFRFGFSSPTNATIATTYGSIYIVDNDSVVDTPTLHVRDVVVDEKAGTASFVVLLGGAKGQASDSVVTVNYATANGTATAGTDYAAASGTLVFAPGETAKTVVVDIADDALAEGAERFFLNLSNPSGATILKGQGVATIGPSDATAVSQPRITAQNMVVGEGDGYVDLVVSLSAPGQNVVTVNYQNNLSYDTASYNTDYSYTAGTLTFAPGETTQVVRIQLIDDGNTEGHEWFGVSLSSPTNATIAQGSPFISIVDNDNVVDTPSLFVRDTIVDEKAGTASFVVMLGGPGGQSSNNPVRVNYTTSNGTATAGADYAAASGTLLFAPGETAKTITVAIADDATNEALERINLTLSGAIGATIVDGRAVAEIGKSDATAVAQPGLSAIDATIAEGDAYVDVVVALSAPAQAAVSTSYYTTNGTAVYNSDYSNRSGTISFAPGETTQVVRIAILDDIDLETLESFNFTLYSATGATIAKPTAAIGIVDNDSTAYNVFSYGRSDDIYTVAKSADVVVENPGGGTDLVRSPVSFTLGVNVENLTLIGGSAVNGTGNALNNLITGNSAANRLTGGAGHDTLNGAGGADTMIGGAGDDIYIVDNAGDTITELTSSGTDRIESNRTFNLGTAGANVENLTLTGTAAINGTGNGLANLITGNAANNRLNGGAGNDTLNGGAGADTLTGGAGNDTFIVDNLGDVITELAGGGTDTVQANRSFLLGAYLENLILTGTGAIDGTGNTQANLITGNAAKNRLDGGGGNDTLNGGADADTMIGGAGNDTFVVDNAGDVVTELAGGGTDTVQTNRSYTLGANLENLALIGTGAVSGTGNTGNNVITGNGVNNLLRGEAGNDTLDGGLGADTMLGGAGNDTYVVNSVGDRVYETTTVGGTTNAGGTDTVQSSISYTLGSFVEKLVLIGSGAINGTGNALANTITGNAAANILNGGAGVDTMIGGAGNDTYIHETLGDRTIEAVNGGIDRVQSSVSHSLEANVEHLTLLGTAAISGTGNVLNNSITGNAGANTLRGNAGNDTLNGAAGNDLLIGGAGSDRLLGGLGNDVFHFDSKIGSDTITDFSSPADTFRFSQAGIRVGDGDTVVDGFAVRNFYGGFSTANEVVVFTQDIFGSLSPASAAAVIGSASSSFAAGATRLFVVDNGVQSGIYLFTSSAVNAQVSAAELTQIAIFNGTTVAASDFVFTT